MSHEIKKPITEKEHADFIVEYNHNCGLRIEDTEMFLFALEENEIMGEKEIEIEVPEYDEEGNPIMIEYEDTETVIDYDEEGNPIGSHEIIVIKHKQQTHIETITVPYPVINSNWEEEQKEKEHEYIQTLSMTRSDFFDNTIKAWGVNEEELLPVVTGILDTLPITDIEKKIAINNYENALNFYRKHALFTLLSGIPITIGEMTITMTAEHWDSFFVEINKRNPDAYKELLPDLES